MSNRRLQRLSVLFSIVVILAMLAGCGAPAAAPAGSGDEAAGGAESASTVGLSAAESAARSIPRSKTLILQRAGNTIADFNVMNPYSLGGLGRIRDTLNKTVYEFLFYYNHNDGEISPWLATGYEYNDTFDEITITLREGVEWSDGETFTANDVKYTLETVRANDTLVFAAQMQEWIKDVEVIDDLTLKIVLNKPNPRWLFSFLAENSEINMAILPQHIWDGQDPETFNNFDLEQGWPVGTGPYRLVAASESQQVFDRRDDWWLPRPALPNYPKSSVLSAFPVVTRRLQHGSLPRARLILAVHWARVILKPHASATPT
ncbi:MAG: ABC transporter substrate-binding protein [Caldilineaceae bacterium]